MKNMGTGGSEAEHVSLTEVSLCFVSKEVHGMTRQNYDKLLDTDKCVK